MYNVLAIRAKQFTKILLLLKKRPQMANSKDANCILGLVIDVHVFIHIHIVRWEGMVSMHPGPLASHGAKSP